MAAKKSKNDQQTMSLLDHLEELRKRMIHSLLGVGVLWAITLYYGRDIVLWLSQPLLESQRQLHLPRRAVSLSVAGGFMVYLKVATVAGLALGLPWVAYQMWLFVAPGLHASERRVVRLLAPFSVGLTVLGILFVYYVFLPAAITFLLMFSMEYPPAEGPGSSPPSVRHVTDFFIKVNRVLIPWHNGPEGAASATQPEQGASPGNAGTLIPVLEGDPSNPREGEVWINGSESELRAFMNGRVRVLPAAAPSFIDQPIEINQYLNFVLLVALVVLISFQLPVVMVILGLIGILDAATLARWRKVIVFLCFVVGIITTPNQDLISNVLFPLLLWGLFEVGLVAMRIAIRRPREERVEGRD
jgi:Sec-independent protein secretion pathway component TatC